jgi:hypothetical protein
MANAIAIDDKGLYSLFGGIHPTWRVIGISATLERHTISN